MATHPAKYLKSIVQALSILAIGGVLFGHVSQGFAQADPGWSKPVNLSLSGTATAPVLVIDSSNVLHAIWVDEANKVYGYRYSRSVDGVTWSQPRKADYPFDPNGAPPVFLASADGWIYIFWISNNALFYARVTPVTISDPTLWSLSTGLLAKNVANYDVIQDSQGTIQLAYIHDLDTPKAPAGVYYRQSGANGVSWSNEVELYESDYYRSATGSETSVRIAASNGPSGERVYVAWDNRPEKRVFMAASENGGQDWGEAQQIKGAEDTGGVDTPFNINVAASGDKVLITWQAGEPGGGKCAVLSQWSQDDGKTWGSVVAALPGRTTCPVSPKFVFQKDNYFDTISSARIVYMWSDVSREEGTATSGSSPEHWNR
jgi:hypothetical protein